MKTLLAVLVGFVMASTAGAKEYYCMVFAYDSKIPTPPTCHIWGSFFEINGNEVVKERTISWAPKHLSLINTASLGYNMDLETTLSNAEKKGRIVRMFGPYKITSEFFDKVDEQWRKPGYYRFLDGMSRHSAQNCIHRLSDVAGRKKTGIFWGWWAAESVTKFFRHKGVIEDINDPDKCDRLLELTGLSRYTIHRISR